MWLWNKIKNPLTWMSGLLIKWTIRRLFFKNIENQDFNRLITFILDLLPNENFIDIIKLIFNSYKSKPSELNKFTIFRLAMLHSLPQEKRMEIAGQEDKKIKYLFIFLLMGGIFKRSLFIIKMIILLPFKLGVYSFIAYLFGIKVDWLLSLFDIFKFNLPSWTYNKLLDLHLSWVSWIKKRLSK